MSSKKKIRVDNLDLVRSLAILAVVLYHTTQMVAGSSFITVFTSIGQYGVDLFFVLSGFLIGGLYWSEQKQHGQINLPKFIKRRILRTAPPYFFALILSFLPVWILERQSFDFGYLFFLQNYYTKIPFFLVSWSLCVEIHFYILLPLFIAMIKRLGFKDYLPFIIGLSAFLPMLFRSFLVDYDKIQTFGFYLTASHFRFDGLLLGVLASYYSVYKPKYIEHISKFSSYVYLLNITFILAIPLIPKYWMYKFGLTILALLFCLLVSALSQSKPLALSSTRLTKLIAQSSYSIYLTHALIIHIFIRLSKIFSLNSSVTWLLMVIAIFIFGYLFYVIVEKFSLAVRDKLAPKV
ncbi:acyltransferase family protein [Nostoc sp.]